MTGMWCVAGFDLSLRQTSKPSMSGIMTSSSTRSHSARSHSASASGPLWAVVTSKYSADSRASRSFTLAGTSSTTRTRALIPDSLLASSRRAQKMTDCFDELADRDRLRQVGLAATFANSLLVALHGKSRDGDHGDGFQLGVVLEPFGHFQARHFRQLDVHEDQVGPVLAREIERLDAVAGADGLVAVRFQQVMEELHVELVVLDNQDGLRHPPRRSNHLRPPPRRTKRIARPGPVMH